jgi:hypothetical protein
VRLSARIQARNGIGAERPHSALAGLTPDEVYAGTRVFPQTRKNSNNRNWRLDNNTAKLNPAAGSSDEWGPPQCQHCHGGQCVLDSVLAFPPVSAVPGLVVKIAIAADQGAHEFRRAESRHDVEGSFDVPRPHQRHFLPWLPEPCGDQTQGEEDQGNSQGYLGTAGAFIEDEGPNDRQGDDSHRPEDLSPTLHGHFADVA